MIFNENYQMVQVSQSASLKIPVGNGINATELDGYIHKFSNNKNVEIYTYNSNDKSLSGAIAFSEMKTQAVGNPHNDNQIIEHQENGKTVYSITYRNNNTHDNIIITTTSRELTQKIFDSIQITNSSNITNNTTTSKTIIELDNTKNSDNPIVGYLGDGTPVYKNDYAKLSEQEPIYNFNPNNPKEVEEVRQKMEAYDRGYEDGVSSSQYYSTPAPSEGSVNMTIV